MTIVQQLRQLPPDSEIYCVRARGLVLRPEDLEFVATANREITIKEETS
jgi:hypothetical protein